MIWRKNLQDSVAGSGQSVSLLGGGGGGGVHSNLGCSDTFLKIVLLLENYKAERGKSIHF